MATTGIIRDLFPDGNTGGQEGAGRVAEDGTGTIYTFLTPDDVSPSALPLSSGKKISFIGNGDEATNVQLP